MPAVRSEYGEWIWFSSWFVWRFLMRFPEDAGFRENRDVQHRTEFPDYRVPDDEWRQAA